MSVWVRFIPLLGFVAWGLWLLGSCAWQRARLRRAPTHRADTHVPSWFERPAEPDVWHCERCGVAPDDEQRAAIRTDPALARVHAEPARFRLHWYCPRCAPLGDTTTSGVAAWDWKS